MTKRPAPLGILGEWRALAETFELLYHSISYPWPRPAKGQHKSIMLIPGFMAGDASLMPMARFCASLGHRPQFCGIWVNSACPRVTLERLVTKVRSINKVSGKPVVVIGHSLGGIYARELAWRYPELVERVITLGAPINEPRASCHDAVRVMASSMALLRGRRDGCLTEQCSCGVNLTQARHSTIPTTVIYSRTDGIVHWESCLDRSGSKAVEHVEVMSSHIGMAVSAEVFRVIAERLSELACRQQPAAAVRTLHLVKIKTAEETV